MNQKQEDVQSELERDLNTRNPVIEKRQRVSEYFRFLTIKKRLFLLGIILCLILIVSRYFMSDDSNVTKVYVTGTYNLPINYVKSVSGITMDSKYFFVIDALVEKRLKDDPFIKSAKVSHGKYGMIEIAIEEKKMVGYYFDEDYIEEFIILMGDGTYAKATRDLMQISSSLPLVVDFKDEEAIKNLADYLGEVSYDVIENMSEIHRYEMSYDTNMLRILMRDGNSIFTSFYSLSTLNHYYTLLPSIEKSGSCIYVDEISKQVYTSNCPWEPAEEEKEKEKEKAE